MQNTKTIDRIIGKIDANQPARLHGTRRTRKTVARNDLLPGVSKLVVAERSAFDDEETSGSAAKNYAFEKARPTKLRDLGKLREAEKTQTRSTAAETEFDDARSKTPRRRQIDPTTCERDYSADEVEFMKALDEYKRTSGRMFPTCSEILEVFNSLGYVKIAPTSEKTDGKRAQKTRRTSTPAFLNDENDAIDGEKIGLDGVCEPLNFA